jgi:type IV pilus assembly protein PilW
MTPPCKRGFTLLEVLFGISISIAVIGAVTGIFLGQQRAFVALDLSRIASQGGRDALLEMEPALRRAGYGLDPRFAFDFKSYACPASPCRDSVSGADNIVFYARNPSYLLVPVNGTNPDGTLCATVGGCAYGNAFHVVTTGASTATVTLTSGTVLQKGRIALFMCPDGTSATMGTLSSAVSGAGAQALGLVPAVAGDPTKQNGFALSTCFAGTNTGVLMFLVDRYHYLIQIYGGVPWLVLDQGLDLDGDGALPENGGDLDDYIPIAAGVEDLQVAYVLNINAPTVLAGGGGPAAAPGAGPDLPSAGGANLGNWVVGDLAGRVEEPDPTAATMPLYSTPPNDPLRFSTSAANIRDVRVTVNLRSLSTDQSRPPNWTGDVEKAAENRSTATLLSGGRFRRFSFQTTVSIRAMESRNSFLF